MKFEIITKEIPIKGKCYAICRELEGQPLSLAIDELCAKAMEHRPTYLYFTCRDEGFDKDIMQFSTDSFMLDFYSDFDFLEKDIRGAAYPEGLEMLPLSAENAALYMEHQNASFFHVANSATIIPATVEEMLSSENCAAGLFKDAEGVCGTFELCFEGEVPEISALSVNINRQGCGLGRRALQALESYISQRGYPRCKLLVASENRRAYSLYLSDGFTFAKRSSRWYMVHPLR